MYTVIASEVSINSDITSGSTKRGTNNNNEGQRRDREGSNDNETEVQQQDQMQHTTPQENEWSYFKTPKELMRDLIKLSEHQDIEYILDTVYDNEEMFYIYLHFASVSLISSPKPSGSIISLTRSITNILLFQMKL